MCCKRGRELVENEEQGKNKMMKSIVVEEQDQKEGSEGETGFVDLDQDMLHNVLKQVDAVTLGRAACVNKLWHRVALDKRLWEPICLRYIDDRAYSLFPQFFRSWIIYEFVKPPPDFYSIDFSKKIRPWVQN